MVADVPATLLVDLAHVAVHVVASAGAERMGTYVGCSEFQSLGFRPDPDGIFAVDTKFLDEDHDGAAVVLQRVQAEKPTWDQGSG